MRLQSFPLFHQIFNFKVSEQGIVPATYLISEHMKYLLFLVQFLFVLSPGAMISQVEKQEVAQVIKSMENVLAISDHYHYRAELLFKEFGADTFGVRNFILNYKSNIGNALYGYDCEIGEIFADSSVFTLMALNTSLYGIFTGTKVMTERRLPEIVEVGSYFETLRNYFMVPEIYQLFVNLDFDKITLIDSNNMYCLSRKLDETETITLFVDKKTHLPFKSISMVKSDDYDLTQTTEVHFFFEETPDSLPVEAFSPNYYLSQGYKYTFLESKNQPNEFDTPSISKKNQKELLDYPFISGKGDTVLIRNYTAKYIILDFWFTACVPCQKALPELNELASNYAKSDLEVIAINCFDMELRKNLESKIRIKNISIPLLFGYRDIIENLNISAFPSYYLITPDRKIEPIIGSMEEVKKAVEQIFKQ